ncbi:MAG: Ig-like domain-containing protein, partial [Micrococcales bacterium]|nr:Ig-like domain-containing protein [Micrococcales bacterium]
TGSNPDPGKVQANGTDSYTVTVNLRNIETGSVYMGSAVVTVTPVGPVGAPYTVVSDSSGTGTATIRSEVAGDFKVTVQVGGDAVETPAVGSGVYEATITFDPGPADGVNSELVAPVNPAVANGSDTQVVRAIVRDAYGVAGAGNLIGGTQVRFAVPANTVAKGCAEGANVTGGTGVTCTMTTATTGTSRGVAELTLVSTKAGSYGVTASVGATAIQTGSPATVRFVADKTVDPSQSTFVLKTLGQTKVAGVGDHTGEVTIRDAYGNLIDRADGQVDVVLTWTLNTDPTHVGSKTVRTVDGVATISFTDTKAGMYAVTATVPTGTVNGSPQPAEFIAGAATSATLVTSSGKVLSDGNAKHYGEVLVTDLNGNPVPGVNLAFTVNGDARIAGTTAAPWNTLALQTSAAGLARVEVTDTKAESVRLTVDGPVGLAVQGSPATLIFDTDVPDPSRSTLVVAQGTASGPGGCVVANGTDTWTGTITLRDLGGLTVGNASVGITADSPVSINPAGPHSTNSSGVVAVTFTSTKTGTHNVRALLGAANISGSPAQVNFCAGPVDGAKSFLVSPTVQATADGVKTQVITANLRDAFDNPVPGAQVRFALPANTTAKVCAEGATVAGGAGAFCTMTAGDTGAETGVAELTLVSTKSGTYDVTARVGAVDIVTGSPAKAKFVSGPVNRDRSKIEVIGNPPKVADGDDTYIVKVTLVDDNDNPVTDEEGRKVTLTFEKDGKTETVEATVGDDGTASVEFGTTDAGDWTGTADFDGKPVAPGLPGELPFVHGPLSPEHSVFTVSTSLALSDGLASHWAKVLLTDAFGNPVPGVDVTLAVSQGAADVPGPWFGTNKATTSVTLTSCPLAATASTPAWCTQNGVYTPGLVWADIRSDEPGTFQVTATAGGAAINHPGDFRVIGFTAGAPDPSKSSWAVSPDPTAAGTKVRANTSDTYAVTVTIKSVSEILVDGAPVRLNLAGVPELSTVELNPNVTGTPLNPVWGKFTFNVKSTKPGTYSFPVQVFVNGAWHDIPNPEAVATLVFAAGDPSTLTSTIATNRGYVEANGADTTARGALDQATLTVTLFDAQGYLVDSPTAQVKVSTTMNGVTITNSGVATNNYDGTYTVKVSSSVPGDAVFGFTIDGAQAVSTVTVKFVSTPAPPVFDTAKSRPDKLSGTSEPNRQIEVYADGSPNAICITQSDAQGKWSCTFSQKLTDGTGLSAVAVNLDHIGQAPDGSPEAMANHTFTSRPSLISVKATTPKLEPEPSDGTEITGNGDPGDTITITDKDGNPVGSTIVGPDGRWTVKPNKPLNEGDIVTITATDPAGNTTTKPWRIGLPRVVLEHPVRYAGQKQTVTGLNFQPGESVSAVMESDQLKLGTKVADANGKVTWTFTVPLGTELGPHSIVLTGPLSGTVSAQFRVIEKPGPGPAPATVSKGRLPFTGANVLGLSGLAALTLLAGWWLIVAAKRRNRREAEDASV